MTTQMLVRLDVRQKKALSSLSRTQGRNASDVVRELISRYIQEHDLTAYLDNLWSRVRGRLTKAGNTEKDVERNIKAWRGPGK